MVVDKLVRQGGGSCEGEFTAVPATPGKCIMRARCGRQESGKPCPLGPEGIAGLNQAFADPGFAPVDADMAPPVAKSLTSILQRRCKQNNRLN